jgi:DNA-binding protein Fis
MLEKMAEHPLFGDIIEEHLARLNTSFLPLKQMITDLEEALIERAMLLCEGNKAAAARLLGLKRTMLQETFKRKEFVTRPVSRWAARQTKHGSYLIDKKLYKN